MAVKTKWEHLHEATKFPINENCDIYEKLGGEHYGKMHELLKDTGKEYGFLPFLLMQVWKKHESKLKVNNSGAELDKAGFDKDERTGEYGVYINIMEHTTESYSSWLAAYQTIFHEFFHNIDYLAGYPSYNYKNDKFEHFDKKYQFGEIVVSEVKKLLDEEKKAKGAEKTRLRTITYDIKNKKHKAALYNIIGAVLYKGKYGCNPDNSRYYTKDGKECIDKCVCGYKLNVSNIYNYNIINCSHRKERKNANNGFYDRNCNKKGECDYNLKKICRLPTNDWCDEIYGHGSDYWLVEEKGGGEDDEDGFPMRLAEEAFALMASEAIANHDAFENTKEYLPDSCEMFEEILDEMLREEFQLWSQSWAYLAR